MSERPILFNGEMVRAILDGRKTQTRRVVKPQPELSERAGFVWKGYAYGLGSDNRGTQRNFARPNCPYGQPGDRLWVRETWFCEQDHGLDYSAADGRYMNIFYRATTPDEAFFYLDLETGEKVIEGPDFRWRPSIHMPRWASRITLEITDVRVERLQDISEADAIDEGVDANICRQFLKTSPPRHTLLPAEIHGFAGLWSSTGGDWDANPWVWVVEFKRVAQELPK